MRFFGILVLTVLLSGSRPAQAGPRENAAREAHKDGTAAYNLGHYEEAARLYETAFKLVHDSSTLFNIAQSYRLAGKTEKALLVYRSFLRELSVDPINRALAEKFVEELKRKLAEEKTAPPPAARPVIEPGPAVVPVAAAPPVVPPPQVAAASPTETADASAGLVTQPNQLSSEAAVEGRPIYKTWWFWTAVGAAVVAGSVTAFLLTRGAPDACDGVGMKCIGAK